MARLSAHGTRRGPTTARSRSSSQHRARCTGAYSRDHGQMHHAATATSTSAARTCAGSRSRHASRSAKDRERRGAASIGRAEEGIIIMCIFEHNQLISYKPAEQQQQEERPVYEVDEGYSIHTWDGNEWITKLEERGTRDLQAAQERWEKRQR